ncbi:UNVERIFIED_ORG: uncharacterized membrane protein (DUF2068 family) [Rhizobium esperanzae]
MVKVIKAFNPRIARAARAYTDLRHTDLGVKANVASWTVHRLETTGKVTPENLSKILKVLEEYGVVVVFDSLTGEPSGLTFTKAPQER